ncbi:MAG: hypothetical protein LBC89_03465 [Bacteroidales bacterium]|jgi:hypothetical protein|nr:hypothetical protein [Bacteroidales bacterium]
MKRTFQIISVLTISIIAFYACIKEEYGSLKNIDKTVHILGSELYIPVGRTDTIHHFDIFDTVDNSYYVHTDTLAFDSATNEIVSKVLRLMYLSPETEVAIFAKFWNTLPRYAKATVYALDENNSRINYGPLEYAINQAGTGYTTTVTEGWIVLNDRDKKLSNMKKLEVSIDMSENDTVNPTPILPNNFLKGELKLRLRNGITTNIDSLINVINEGF